MDQNFRLIQSLFSLSGRTAIITGASRGLGRGAVAALRGAGANVVLVGRDERALAESAANSHGDGEALIHVGDVTQPVDALAAVDAALSKFGSVDILVNNAGIIRRSAALEITSQDWNNVIDTNLNAVFNWSQIAGKQMIEQGGGKIINVASLLSFSGGLNVASYAAAKGGVAQLTKALANEWAKYNVNVNAIVPGYFMTDATAALRNNSERSAHILSRIPAGRWGEPDDLAGLFVYLASRASDYVNGAMIAVDGGFLSY